MRSDARSRLCCAGLWLWGGYLRLCVRTRSRALAAAEARSSSRLRTFPLQPLYT